jgi:hypothetical protein
MTSKERMISYIKKLILHTDPFIEKMRTKKKETEADVSPFSLFIYMMRSLFFVGMKMLGDWRNLFLTLSWLFSFSNFHNIPKKFHFIFLFLMISVNGFRALRFYTITKMSNPESEHFHFHIYKKYRSEYKAIQPLLDEEYFSFGEMKESIEKLADKEEKLTGEKLAHFVEKWQEERDNLLQKLAKANEFNRDFYGLLSQAQENMEELQTFGEKMTNEYRDLHHLLLRFLQKVELLKEETLTLSDLEFGNPYSIYRYDQNYLYHLYSSLGMLRKVPDHTLALDHPSLEDRAIVKVAFSQSIFEIDTNDHLAFLVHISKTERWIIEIKFRHYKKELLDILRENPENEELTLLELKEFSTMYVHTLFDILSFLCRTMCAVAQHEKD